MKRVTAFVGSARKKNTYRAVEQFLNDLQALGGVEYEIVTLHDYTLAPCRGCEVCLWKGEEFCPLKDDRDVLMDKIMASDGVVFATPTYNGQVSGIMKTFLDRFAFVCHRPRYFGKVCTSIVTYSFARNDSMIRQAHDDSSRDYRYYVAKGWLDSDYYYPTRLNPLKKVAGKLFDTMAVRKGLA